MVIIKLSIPFPAPEKQSPHDFHHEDFLVNRNTRMAGDRSGRKIQKQLL